MRIALVTPYADYPGGVESVNRLLCDIFRGAGHSVDLITADGFRGRGWERFMVKLIGLPYVTAKRFKSLAARYDLVIANGEFSWGITHPRAVNLFHGSYAGYRDYLKVQWNFKTFLHLSRRAWVQRHGAAGKHVVAVSEFVRGILENDGVKVRQVIPNCVDTERFRPMPPAVKRPYLFVGTNHRYAKGFDVLEALAQMGLEIDCVTDREPSQKLGWLQNIENDRMPALYNRYKILVFPSRFEGMPMVPLEAMACGVPVVIGNVGLGPELKNVIPEFVVETYDADAFARKIRHIEAHYETYAGKARRYVERYHAFDRFERAWLDTITQVADA